MTEIKLQSDQDDALKTPQSRSYENERAGALGREREEEQEGRARGYRCCVKSIS